MRKSWEYPEGKMEVYPLVMTHIANWKDPPCFMGKSTISMVMFSSYVTNYQRVTMARMGFNG